MNSEYGGVLSTMVRKHTYKVGMDVTVSVKELYESQTDLRYVKVRTEADDSGRIVYWDLYNDRYGIACMDGW